MEDCENQCQKAAIKGVKINFMDRIVGRTIEEKINNFCHLDCLKKLNIKNIKRNGRWGFKPFLGMTEAFSSLFALLSFICMFIGFNRKVRNNIHLTPMANLYLIQYYVANAAFLSSFLFHIRETAFTRYADYFTAFASILAGFIVSINRMVLEKKPKAHAKFHFLTLRIGISYLVVHIYKMAFNEFDYLYNKVACGLMFSGTCMCNLTIFLRYREFKYARAILYSTAYLLAAGAIEILDISPIFYLFDTHAFWHLLMAVATPLYIEFISNDILQHAKLIKKKSKKTPEKKKKNRIIEEKPTLNTRVSRNRIKSGVNE